jgi:tetratricopeptide (TPR) repeat protein
MRSSSVNSSLSPFFVALVALLLVRGLLQPVERLITPPSSITASDAEQFVTAAGQGGALALLGGMRSMLASGCWLQTNLAWEKRDLAGTVALIDLTVAADERPVYFWLNGARMIANDMPEWRMTGLAPKAFRAVANEQQAQLALKFLEKGLRWHGADAAIYVEMANIQLRRRGDVEAAARFYRLAAEQPHSPYYAARIYGELLRELHRPAEALAWLRQTLVTLPPDDPSAVREVVEDRIRALERELAGT